MIETKAGLSNSSAIAATKDVDFVFIGSGDLALSLGAPTGSPACERASKDILLACESVGKPCGIFTITPEAAARAISDGFRMTVVATDVSAVQLALTSAIKVFKGRRSS